MTIAVDFDGTLCEHRYPAIGAPNVDLIRTLVEVQRQGHKLILWTCREGQYLADAVEFCRGYGLTFDAVNQNLVESMMATGADPRKIFADIYLDDRGMTPETFRHGLGGVQ